MPSWPGGLDELGREPLDPPADGDVIDGDAPLGELFFDIAVRQPVPQGAGVTRHGELARIGR
jgi:hypothetical protein